MPGTIEKGRISTGSKQVTKQHSRPPAPDEATARALKLWVVMNRAIRAITDRLEQQVQQHELTMSEFSVLEALYHKGPLPLGEIGNRVLRSGGSMTYIIDKLEKRGLLRRTACPNDRRSIHAVLTDEGVEKMAIVFPEHANLINDLMHGISAADQDTTINLIRGLGLSAAERHLVQAAAS